MISSPWKIVFTNLEICSRKGVVWFTVEMWKRHFKLNCSLFSFFFFLSLSFIKSQR